MIFKADIEWMSYYSSLNDIENSVEMIKRWGNGVDMFSEILDCNIEKQEITFCSYIDWENVRTKK